MWILFHIVSQEEGWVVCRAFKKRMACPSRGVSDMWVSSYSIIPDHRLDYLQNQTKTSLLGKKESELDNLSFLAHPNNFVQLPELDVNAQLHNLPSLSTVNNLVEEQSNVARSMPGVTDWRALDKFVASQLSPEENFGADQTPSVSGTCNESEEVAFLLLQGEQDEFGSFNELLSSDASHCLV
jgi:hypothetical protein